MAQRPNDGSGWYQAVDLHLPQLDAPPTVTQQPGGGWSDHPMYESLGTLVSTLLVAIDEGTVDEKTHGRPGFWPTDGFEATRHRLNPNCGMDIEYLPDDESTLPEFWRAARRFEPGTP